MLLLLSPAKSLDMDSDRVVGEATLPEFRDDMPELLEIMRGKNTEDIKKLMKVSDAIAELNVERYAHFSTCFTEQNSRQAILAFSGDVYRGLDVATLSDAEILYAQSHIRMLSGLYGLLRPLDLMQPYRLEMGTILPNSAGKNLYVFWQTKLTHKLNKSGEFIVNLASQEYSKAVDFSAIKAGYVHIHFKENKAGTYRVVGTLAKKARGIYARYVVQEKIATQEGLRSFDGEGYAYNDALSDAYNYVFTRG